MSNVLLHKVSESVYADAMNEREEMLWAAIVDAAYMARRAQPHRAAEQGGYRDGLMAAYCIMTGQPMDDVYPRMREALKARVKVSA